MRTNIVIAGGAALVAYVLGTRTNRPVMKSRESVGHQVVRLWDEPKARKRRAKRAEQVQKDARATAKSVAKTTRTRAKEGAKIARKRAKQGAKVARKRMKRLRG